MTNESTEIKRFSRLDAVRHQLDMAIRAYFQFDDPVSALTLAGAAERVLSDLQPQDGILDVDAWSIRACCNLHIKDECQKKAAKRLRDGYDYLRHADKPSRQKDLSLHPLTVDFYLLLAIKAYQQKAMHLTLLMQAFVLWAATTHPNWLSDNHPAREALLAARNDYQTLSRSERFQAVLDAIESKSLIPNP